MIISIKIIGTININKLHEICFSHTFHCSFTIFCSSLITCSFISEASASIKCIILHAASKSSYHIFACTCSLLLIYTCCLIHGIFVNLIIDHTKYLILRHHIQDVQLLNLDRITSCLNNMEILEWT